MSHGLVSRSPKYTFVLKKTFLWKEGDCFFTNRKSAAHSLHRRKRTLLILKYVFFTVFYITTHSLHSFDRCTNFVLNLLSRTVSSVLCPSPIYGVGTRNRIARPSTSWPVGTSAPGYFVEQIGGHFSRLCRWQKAAPLGHPHPPTPHTHILPPFCQNPIWNTGIYGLFPLSIYRSTFSLENIAPYESALQAIESR